MVNKKRDYDGCENCYFILDMGNLKGIDGFNNVRFWLL